MQTAYYYSITAKLYSFRLKNLHYRLGASLGKDIQPFL